MREHGFRHLCLHRQMGSHLAESTAIWQKYPTFSLTCEVVIPTSVHHYIHYAFCELCVRVSRSVRVPRITLAHLSKSYTVFEL